MRSKNHDGARGVSYIVVMGIIGTLLIAVLSYNTLLRNERLHMYRTIYSDNALILAEAAMEILQKVVEEELSRPACERKNDFFDFRDLIKPKDKFETIKFDSKKLTRLIANSKPIAKLIDIFGDRNARISSVNVAIEKGSIKYYAEKFGQSPGIAPNTREKFGLVRYQVEVDYFGIKKNLVVKKQIKVFSILPKVLRFFTLFIRNIPKDEDLNKITVDQDGFVQKGKPLILQNGEFNRESSPLAVGMVFLGNAHASDPLVLRLSHGAEKRGVCETFQLIEDLYLDLIYAKKYPRTPHNVVHIDYGMSEEMRSSKDFGINLPREVNTSVIKLFGTAEKPSPTRVLGNVRRAYVRLSALQDKATKGMQYMVEMPSVSPAEYSSKGGEIIAYNGEEGGGNKLSCETIAVYLFPSVPYSSRYREYAKYMTQIIDTDPYSFGLMLDIRDRRGMKCDHRKIPDLTARLFPNSSNNFGGKPAKPADGEFLYDDLRKIAFDEKYLLPYVSYKFNDSNDIPRFRELFCEPSPSGGADLVKLGSIVSFEKDITLPAMVVEKGGIIICKKGNITVSGDIVCDPLKQQVLTLIALDGDVIVGAGRVDAMIIALKDGTKFIPTKELKIYGGLAVNSMDFSNLAKHGGEIRFDTKFSTPEDNPALYFASVQPDVRNWEME